MNKGYLKLMFFYIVLIINFSLIMSIFIISTDPNIITLNYNIPFKKELNALAPQGWAFFTKDVHKDYFNIYKIENDSIYPIQIKSAELSQFLGLKRANRSIHHKISTIISNIKSGLWYEYKGNVLKIPQENLSKVSIKVKKPIIYGMYLIEYGKPTPYEWFKSKIKPKQTMNYIIIEIK